MRTSEQIESLAAAMAKCQGALASASKDKTNPNFGSRYADLAALWDVARKPLADNGLSVWQEADYANGDVLVTTRIVHESGQWVEHGPLAIPVTKHKHKTVSGDYEMLVDAHSVGGAVTYGKRFAFGGALGIVADDEDDDGNKASGKREQDDEGDTSLPFYDIRRQLKDLAQQIEGHAGGLWHEHVRTASAFKGKDGKEQAFGDPFNPKLGEKWLTSTLKRLRATAEDLQKTDAAAGEAAELFT